jgi:flagellar biosynthesis/type III secretory pathway protein FliH
MLANQLRERTADDLIALRDQVRQLTEERDRLAADRARGDAASAAELERARAALEEERHQFHAERARLVEDTRQAALEEGRRAGLVEGQQVLETERAAMAAERARIAVERIHRAEEEDRARQESQDLILGKDNHIHLDPEMLCR